MLLRRLSADQAGAGSAISKPYFASPSLLIEPLAKQRRATFTGNEWGWLGCVALLVQMHCQAIFAIGLGGRDGINVDDVTAVEAKMATGA